MLDAEDINKVAVDQLSGLGIGRQYAEGLVSTAHQLFQTEGDESAQSKLIGIGHSHYGVEDLGDLINSIFDNTNGLRQD